MAVFRFVVGAMQGHVDGLAQAPTEAVLPLGTRRHGDSRHRDGLGRVPRRPCAGARATALLAAVMIAVMPLHVRESHYVLTDVPVTFFVMLTLLLSLRAHERATAWSFALAGAAAGLAGATKYNGVLAVLMPLLACLMTPAARPSRPVAHAVDHRRHAGGVLPGRALHLPRSADVPQSVRAAVGGIPRAAGGAGADLADLPQAPPQRASAGRAALIVIAGVALGSWRVVTGPTALKWALVTMFPLVYFRFIANQNIYLRRATCCRSCRFSRMLAAAAVVWAWAGCGSIEFRRPRAQRRDRRADNRAVGPPAYRRSRFDANAAKEWTTEQAYEWITGEAARGRHIRLEGSLAIKLPAAYQDDLCEQLRLDSARVLRRDGIQYLVASSQCYRTVLR